MRQALRILEREIGHALDREAECCGISQTQYFLLETGMRGSLTLTELADILSLDISTLSRTADALAAAELIRRQPDILNRRKVSISLSEKGEAKVGSINESCDGSYARILERIPINKRTQVMESIRLLADAFMRDGRGLGAEEKRACCSTGQGIVSGRNKEEARK